jgi:hypothetical protein
MAVGMKASCQIVGSNKVSACGQASVRPIVGIADLPNGWMYCFAHPHISRQNGQYLMYRYVREGLRADQSWNPNSFTWYHPVDHIYILVFHNAFFPWLDLTWTHEFWSTNFIVSVSTLMIWSPPAWVFPIHMGYVIIISIMDKEMSEVLEWRLGNEWSSKMKAEKWVKFWKSPIRS